MRRWVQVGVWRMALAVPAVAMAACVASPRFDGPLPVRNQHPAQLTVLHLPPAGAAVLPRGATETRVEAAYSSLFLSGATLTSSYLMDGEYLRFGPSFRVGLDHGLEFGVALPFAHASGGFLDSFLVDYHDAFGFPDQNRDSAARNDYRVEATRNGRTAWSVADDGVELLDVPLYLTWQLTEVDSGLGIAARVGIELPTGDDDRGYGNGGVDYGVGLLLEHRFGGVAWTAQLQHTFAATPARSRAVGFHFADVSAVGSALEVPLSERLSGFAELGFATSTLRDLGPAVTARTQLLLWLGGRLRLGADSAIELAFGEDLNGFVSPDFTAWLGFTTATGR